MLWVNRVLLCTPLLSSGHLQTLRNFSVLPYFIRFSLTVFCLIHFRWDLCVSCSWSWLCHSISLLLPTLLLVGSICDLTQFTKVGENYPWRVSARPFHSFSNNEPRNHFSLLNWFLGTAVRNFKNYIHAEVDSRIPPDMDAIGAVPGSQFCTWLWDTAQV